MRVYSAEEALAKAIRRNALARAIGEAACQKNRRFRCARPMYAWLNCTGAKTVRG
jgi:hypothetical protein